MAEKVFLGNAFSSGSSNPYPDIHYINHFEALYSGVLTRIGMYSNSPGNIKFNLYDIVAGVPMNLIFADDIGIVCVDGQTNFIDVSSACIEVASGTLYGVGGITDGSGVITYKAVVGERTYKAGLSYATFSAPDPISGYITQSPTGSIYSFVVYGIEPPTVSSTSVSLIRDGQTGVTLSGTDFMNSGAKLELCDGPVYTSATKVEQTITGQSDTSIEFTVSKGPLSQGTHYLFVTTSLGQINAVGYPIGLIGNDYGANIPQQGDVYLFDDTDGGNIEVSNGFVTMTKYVETLVYLCWFGGNREDDGSKATEKLQWWGNEGEPPERQYRGKLQSLLYGRPVTSALLPKIEEAALDDLKNGMPKSLFASASVYASAPSPKRVNLRAEILTKTGTPYTVNIGVNL
jgi:hypothetical protein